MSPEAGVDAIESLLYGRAPRCGPSVPVSESGAHVTEALRRFPRAAGEANAHVSPRPLLFWRREDNKLWSSQHTR
jgi:hypothetical protein